MKLLQKVIAGFLLVFGVPLSLVAVTEITNPQTSPQDRDDALAALLILTLPAASVGGWVAWRLYKAGDKETRDRLRSTFYRLVKENNGQLSVLYFAMEAQLSGEQARDYLDERAKEFNATFEPLDDGGIVYQFHL